MLLESSNIAKVCNTHLVDIITRCTGDNAFYYSLYETHAMTMSKKKTPLFHLPIRLHIHRHSQGRSMVCRTEIAYFAPTRKWLLFFAVSDASSVPRTKTACLCSSLLRCTWKGEMLNSLYFAKSQSTPFCSQCFFN